MTHRFSPALQRFLSGRALLETELPFSPDVIEQHLHQGYIQTTPGLARQCNRCANQQERLIAEFPCARCGKRCRYCRKCIMMGRVSECTPLFTWMGPVPEVASEADLQWSGELSPGQEAASRAVVKAVERKQNLLVWAVCGAGKTEVLFAGIETALQKDQRVCIATPRTDVVLELAPRLQKVFPAIEVAALYGGSDDRHLYSPLTIATTHQLLRFDKAFDTMIVDEVDAFPYTFDNSLQFAVKKAAKLDAANIFLTATPKASWQAECRAGKRRYVKIPARYHRYSLPVPEFRWIGNWRKALEKKKLPAPLLRWAQERLSSKKQVLIFFPHIQLMEAALPLFRELHEGIEEVHSAEPDRKEKVERMRKREIPILLTTTILERGVTFPNIDVAVLGAEDDTFTEAALVQIAGRVGRSAEFPKGVITFFHYGRTKAMLRALIHIDEMNREAKKKGLIDR